MYMNVYMCGSTAIKIDKNLTFGKFDDSINYCCMSDYCHRQMFLSILMSFKPKVRNVHFIKSYFCVPQKDNLKRKS